MPQALKQITQLWSRAPAEADVAAGQGLAEVEHISSDASIVILTQEPDDPDTCQKPLLFAVLVNLAAGCVLARAEIVGERRDTIH